MACPPEQCGVPLHLRGGGAYFKKWSKHFFRRFAPSMCPRYSFRCRDTRTTCPRQTVEQRWAIILRSVILVYVISTESFSGRLAWKSSILPQYHFATQSPSVMFHFVKSSWRSLLLEARCIALNSPNSVWRPGPPGPVWRGAKALPYQAP